MIHRDIKPGNIMINARGVVKVADFGIALASNDISSSKLTSTGALVGTPGYLPPEVCLGKAVDQRSDIFALGIVLFESLTGRMPFNDESPLKLMLSIVESNIPDIREFNPDVDDETVRILGRMLEKDPSNRYQSCDQLNADLQKHPLALGPLALLQRKPEESSKATMIGLPTPQTGGHRPPRGATPPPQVGARTQPVMAAPPPSPVMTQPQSLLGQPPGATVQTGQLAPPKKSKAVPIAIAALLLLAAGGYGLSRMLPFGKQAEPAAVATPADASPSAPAPAPPVSPPAQQQPDGSQVAAATPTSVSAPAAAVLQPAAGAVAVDPTAIAVINEEAVNAEVERRQRLLAAAAEAKARRDKRRAAAAAAAASDTGEDESVSEDEDSGGGGARDAASLRKAYLCRTQRRC